MTDGSARTTRILFVCADPPETAPVRKAFEQAGIAVEITSRSSSREALAHLEERPIYYAVIADQHLPDQSGLELFETLRQRHFALPFVLIVPPGASDITEAARERGVDICLKRQSEHGHLSHLPRALALVIQANRDRREKEEATSKLNCMEERFRLLVEAVEDYAIFMLDPAGHVESWNSGAERIMGYRSDEILGEHVSVFHGSKSSQVLKASKELRQALRLGKYEVEGWRYRKDGTRIWLNDSTTAVLDRQGSICGLAKVLRDFTERKRDQERIQESQAQLSKAQSIAHLGSWTMDFDIDQIRWCDELYRIVGRRPTDDFPSYRELTECVHLEDRRAFESQLRRAIATNEVTVADHRVVRPDGEVRYVCSEICLDSESDGKPRRLTGTMHDITERKHEEMKARFLYETTSTALLAAIHDYDHTLSELASFAVPFFADWVLLQVINEEGCVRRSLCDHVSPNHEASFRVLEERLDQERVSFVPAIRAMRDRHAVLLPHATAELMVEQEGIVLELLRELDPRSVISVPLAVQDRLVGSMTFVYSSTDRRYGLADISFANSLAQRAAIALENARLYDEARETDRRKDEFLAMLAHELRNPLAPVRNALEILRLADNNPKLVEKARTTIERQVESMVRLVDDLLDLSRIMRGKINLREDDVLLGTIVERAIETSMPQVQARNQVLRLQLPDENVWLRGDEVRLVQVVSNLLNNAAKYTDCDGNITVHVEVIGGELILRVRDDGIGMDPKMLSRIFDLFLQIESSVGLSHGGLGIGLTLVRQLVELHHGSVAAYSDGAGKGSEFVIRLPILRVDAASGATETNEQSTPPEASQQRVLVIDDNVDAAEMLVELLRLEGHDVAIGHTGAAALEIARSFAPHVILLDIGLPDMSGHQVARELRLRPETSNCRMIAITGFGQDVDRLRSREAGFDFHLVKPVMPDDLRKLLVDEVSPSMSAPLTS